MGGAASVNKQLDGDALAAHVRQIGPKFAAVADAISENGINERVAVATQAKLVLFIRQLVLKADRRRTG